MNRRVWPSMALFAGHLHAASKSGQADQVIAEMLPTFNDKAPDQQFGPPVALRWVTSNLLGIPRRPFRVWRRQEKYAEHSLGSTAAAGGSLRWGEDEMYIVAFDAQPANGKTVVVEAVDVTREPIPGQRIEFSRPQRGLFRFPHIASLRISGDGQITNVSGVNQFELVNDDAWQMIEVVGLPFKEGQIAPAAYSQEKQGFAEPGRQPVEAALERLTIAAALHEVPPSLSALSIPDADWPAPVALRILQFINEADPPALQMLRACLLSSDDATFGHRQADFRISRKAAGMRQRFDETFRSEESRMALPVLDMTMLAVSSDTYAATALGFGTIDFPPEPPRPLDKNPNQPPGLEEPRFDYMITAEFELPLQGKIELAALAQMRPLPEAPKRLTAKTLQVNRPERVDEPASEAVELSWNHATQSQGYGVFRNDSSTIETLNRPRRYTAGFLPYLANQPAAIDGDMPLDATADFTQPESPVPLAQPHTASFLVAGHDVFGRWSKFATTNHTSRPLEILKPGLHNANLVVAGTPRDRSKVDIRLEIEVSWDWSDRSVTEIEFVGGFFAGGASAAVSKEFLPLARDEKGDPLVVFFNKDEPAIMSTHEGRVERLKIEGASSEPAVPFDGDRIRYRVTVEGLTCDFSATNQVHYAVFARATEAIRLDEPSHWVGPVTSELFDPVPPPVPALTGDLHWTALPRAGDKARGVLTWSASEAAAGYIVWQAVETALRHAVDPNFTPPPPTMTAPQRVADLVGVLADPNAENRGMAVYARLKQELIMQPKIEVELPGSAEVLYSFRVSAVSSSNMESARSNPVFFAVPKRNVPARPRLLLREESNGVRIHGLPGRELPPAGFHAFRVRDERLLRDVGLKGPPVIRFDDARWQPRILPGLHVPDEDSLSLIDDVPRSWHPYFYQIVAVATDRMDIGQLGGISPPSTVQKIILAPLEPPTFEITSDETSGSQRTLRFSTNLPFRNDEGRSQIFLSCRHNGQSLQLHRFTDEIASLDESDLSETEMDVRHQPTGFDAAELIIRKPAEYELTAIVIHDPRGRMTQWHDGSSP